MSASEFRQNFMRICKMHRTEKRALAFVFLLFDRRHPQVCRVIDDSRFYQALDAISGSLLTVFFIHCSSEMPPPERRDVWDRQGEEALNIIRAKFDIQWDSSKPAMLFFQVDGSRISHGRLVSFPDERYEDTFIAMKTLLKAAADSLAKVQPEYERNTGELFYLVDNALQNESFKRNFRFLYKTVKAIKGLLF